MSDNEDDIKISPQLKNYLKGMSKAKWYLADVGMILYRYPNSPSVGYQNNFKSLGERVRLSSLWIELKEFLRYEKFFKDNYNHQLEQEVWIAAKSIESMFHDSRKINTLTVVKAGVPMHLSYFTDHFEPRKKDQPIWSYYQYAADIKRSMSYPEQAKLIFGGAKVIVVKTMIGERRFNDVILRSSVVLILVILIQQHLNYIKAKRK